MTGTFKSHFFTKLMLIWFLFALLALPFMALAGTTNLLTYTLVNGTNNGATFFLTGIQIPSTKSFLFQVGNITNAPTYITNNGVVYNLATNAITFNYQISIDPANSNWVTIATFNPSGTNGESDQVTPYFNSITLPMRVQVVTTNSVGASTFVTQ